MTGIIQKMRWAGRALLCVAAVAVLWPQAAASQVNPPEDEEVLPEVADRARVLGELYEQLRSAENEQSAKDISDAIERVWLKSGSDTVDLLMSRAIRLMQEEEYDTALEILDAVVEIAPDYSEGWNQRATLHFLMHNLQDSLNDLRRVLVLDPRHFKAVNGLGLILQELGDKRSALKAYRRALKLNPFLGDAQQAIDELEREVEGQGI